MLNTKSPKGSDEIKGRVPQPEDLLYELPIVCKSPLLLFVGTLLCIFWVEYAVMILLLTLMPLSLVQKTVIDALALSVCAMPILYFIVIQPFRLVIKDSKKLRDECQRLQSELARYGKVL